MDSISQELGIPRKQIKDSKRPDRYIVVTHRAWLRCLLQDNSLTKFPVHPGFDEWPINEESIGRDWCLTYFTVIYFNYSIFFTPFNARIHFRFIKSILTK